MNNMNNHIIILLIAGTVVAAYDNFTPILNANNRVELTGVNAAAFTELALPDEWRQNFQVFVETSQPTIPWIHRL